jgi:hypothetical protein
LQFIRETKLSNGATLTFFFALEILALLFVGVGSAETDDGRMLAMLVVPPIIFIGSIVESFKKKI